MQTLAGLQRHGLTYHAAVPMARVINASYITHLLRGRPLGQDALGPFDAIFEVFWCRLLDEATL
eukprot:8017349-Alexandrium_andersonii.AAC.1